MKFLLFLRSGGLTITILCLCVISCGGKVSEQDSTNTTNDMPEDVIALALSSSVVTLSWDGFSDLSSVNYQVFRNNQLIGSTSETQFIDADLTPNSTYDYYVAAIDADQNINEVSQVTTVTTLPVQTTPNRFFASAREQGSTTFQIQPIESVNANETVRVSFGVPFPKEFLSNIDAFRIFDEAGREMQIFAKELLPWRDLGSLTDLASVRSVLVQMDVVFSPDSTGKLSPLNFTLEWGQSRSLPMLSETNVRANWVLVDDYKYTGSYSIYEPKAYAIFTPEWYGKNVIKTRVLPFFSHKEFSAHDHAFTLFGDTAINHVDPRVLDANLQPYLKSYANWLFDRASTLYQLAFRSGEFRFLREAHRAAQFYASYINDEGYFSLKPSNDLKYSYGESILTNYLLMGDDQYIPKVQNMISAWDSFKTFYTLQTRFWTERHAATQLMGYVTAYELFGDAETGQKAKNAFSDLRRMQLFPDEGVPMTGGLMHLSSAHGEGGNNFITSPWMSALLLDAVERYYIHSSDSEVAAFVITMAEFLNQKDVALWEWAGYSGREYYFLPHYLAGIDLPDGGHGGGPGDSEHAIDVAKIMALAQFFWTNLNLGSADRRYLDTMSLLYRTHVDKTLNNWIRPNAPQSGLASYRLSPPRKFSWWFRTTSNMDFLIGTGTRLNHYDGLTKPRLNVTQRIVGNPDYYSPGDTINLLVELENIGSIVAENVLLVVETVGMSGSQTLDLVATSDNASIRGDFVAWKIGSVTPQDTMRFDLRFTVNDFPVLPSLTRPVNSIINEVRVSFCGPADNPSECVSPSSNYDLGTQTYTQGISWTVIPPKAPDTPPKLNFSSHADGAEVSGLETFSVSLGDDIDGIRQVEFYLDGQLIETVENPPYSIVYDTDALSDSIHQITVKAYDNVGSVTEESINIIPLSPDITIPEVTIISPINDQIVACDPVSVDYTAIDSSLITHCTLVLNDVSVDLPSCQEFSIPSNHSLITSRLRLPFSSTADIVQDYSQNSLVGNVVGATSIPNGLIGEAVEFDGLDDYIQFDNAQLGISNDITISFWMNAFQDEGLVMMQDWQYVGVEYGWAVLLGPNNHASNNARSISWSSSNNVSNNNQSIVIQTDPDTITLNTWQHIAIVKRDEEVIIYINGQESARGNIAVGQIAWPFNADKNFYIGKGADHPTLYQNNFKGQLDELYIWDHALSTAQVGQIYNNLPSIGTHALEVQAIDLAGNIGDDTINYQQVACQ